MILIKGNIERVAEDPAAIQALIRQGYKPINNQPEAAAEEEPEVPADLESLKVQELRALATKKGIDGVNALTKAELIDLLKG